MPFKFPYTNFQELNLDWIIKKVKDLSKQIEDDSSIVSEYIDRLIAVEDKADNAEATATAADARATGANNTANSALTLATQAKQTAEIADLSTTLLGLKIGDLSSLYTTAKDTIVNAINEVWSIFHNATAVTNVTPAGTDPAVTYSNGVFTFDLPEGGDPDAVTHAELDAAIDDVEDTIDALTDRVDGLEDSIDDKADVIIATESGDIASFPDGTATPLKALIVNFEPVQAGTGDPSPSNVRPISGWNGINITHTGKSISEFLHNTYSSSTYYNGYAGFHNGWKIVDRTLKYTYSIFIDNRAAGSGASSAAVWFTAADRATYVDGVVKAGNTIAAGSSGFSTVTVDASTLPNTVYLMCGMRLQIGGITSNPMLQVGANSSPFEPYNGNVYNVNFSETVYGAKPDIISGAMPITHVLEIVDGSRIGNNGLLPYGGLQIYYNPSLPKAPAVTSPFEDLKSNLFTPSSSAVEYAINGRTVNGNIYFNMPSTVTTIEEAQAWFANNPTQIWYKLATPIETTITPVPVTALKGYNNIWSDAGSVEVTYRADTKGYIDKLIAQVQALALGG